MGLSVLGRTCVLCRPKDSSRNAFPSVPAATHQPGGDRHQSLRSIAEHTNYPFCEGSGGVRIPKSPGFSLVLGAVGERNGTRRR